MRDFFRPPSELDTMAFLLIESGAKLVEDIVAAALQAPHSHIFDELQSFMKQLQHHAEILKSVVYSVL